VEAVWREIALSLAIGFFSGVLSGAFGIGGGVVTTPAIRLILGAPALIAVGTPLPVIIPSALTGAFNYHRQGFVDVRASVTCGLFGSLFAVAGALLTRFVGGSTVLLATAALIFYVAGDMIVSALRSRRAPELAAGEEADAFGEAPAGADGRSDGDAEALTNDGDAGTLRADSAGQLQSAPQERQRGGPQGPGIPVVSTPLWRLAVIGGLTGLYSGFLGLGGGFVLVPMLTRWLHFDIKRAIGTSLLAISILAVPGTITHALLGNVDWLIALMLTVAVVPGAIVGARLTLGSSDRATRLGFAIVLLLTGIVLAAGELGWLPVGAGR
jgi:uncharacterized protein